jgi:transcriptional regulator with XRE-family HTH domain
MGEFLFMSRGEIVMNFTTYKQKIGENIRYRRIRYNLSQEGLEQLTGIHRITISQIERGKKNVSLRYLCLLPEILNIEITDLFK